MKRRFLSGLLLLSLFAALLPCPVRAADSANAMNISEDGISLIKGFEGYSQYPFADVSQWSIGYGVACNPDDYPDGVTLEEADALLREKLTDYEGGLNGFLSKNSIAFSQNEYDALVSLTYNVGVGWLNKSYRFWTMARAGLGNYTDNQIASAIGVWSHIGSTISTGLLQRRISEVRLFLYNDYSGENSTNFHYIIFNGNGGTIDTDVMLYRENEKYGTLTNAQREGYSFAGWYTAPTGGTRVTAGDTASANLVLYAHWSDQSASSDAQNSGFSDVSASDWYFSYVKELAEAKIIDGYTDGTFRPRTTVTAGQALKLILLAANCGEQAPTASHWASGYLSYAVDKGFIGASELSNLNSGISREKIAKLAARALGLSYSGTATPFSDTSDENVLALYQAGII